MLDIQDVPFNWVPERVEVKNGADMPYLFDTTIWQGISSIDPSNIEEFTPYLSVSYIRDESKPLVDGAMAVIDHDEIPGHDVWYVWRMDHFKDSFQSEDEWKEAILWNYVRDAFLTGFVYSRLERFKVRHPERTFDVTFDGIFAVGQ